MQELEKFLGVLGVNELKYAIRIFKGAKGVAIATKCRQKCQNCTYFTSVQVMETFFARKIGFSGMENSNVLFDYFRKRMTLPWQPKLGENEQKLD